MIARCVLLFGIASTSWAGLLPLSSPYVMTDGLVIGEAENYHAKSIGNGDEWLEAPTTAVVPAGVTFENASGGLFMQVQPDNGPSAAAFSGAGVGAAIDYKIQINTPGTYRLYLRWDGHNNDSDSLYAGILELVDGIGGTHADWYEDNIASTSDFALQNWNGTGQAEVNVANTAQNPMTWTISAGDIAANTGVFTLRIVGREDGVALDRWRFQLDSLPDPNPVPATGLNVLIGQEEFDYADGDLVGRSGGSNWDFDNTTNNGAFIGFRREGGSTWDGIFGNNQVVSGTLQTLNSAAKREFSAPTEEHGAINDWGSSPHKQVYFRVQMTWATGAEWGGISAYDFGSERIFFGVPGTVGPSGQYQFGVEQDGTTYSSIQPVAGQTYTLVAKLDFVNDVIALYVNPDMSLPEGGNAPAASRTYTNNNWCTAVRLASGGTGATTWDGLAVCTSWAALQQAYPTPQPVSGPDVVIGTDAFDYDAGAIAGRDGGTHFDFDNQNADAFVGYTQLSSAWQNVVGAPFVDGGRFMLSTQESSARRTYGRSEANGSFSSAASSEYKQLFYRFEMIRGGDATTWSGASVYDGNSERILFGVPFAANPASGQREFAIHNLVNDTWSYTGIVPVAGARYFLVGKVDFATGTASLFVNPNFASATEPVPNATMAWTPAVSTAVRFGSGGGAPTYWDHLAVTTSWSSMRTLYPTPVLASGADLIIGADSFSYPDGSIGAQNGGLHWDFENVSFGDGSANYSLLPAPWRVLWGAATMTGGTLRTQESGAIRSYSSNPADGAFNRNAGTLHRTIYKRFEITRSAGAAWSGASFYDFDNERVFVGVPGSVNPASGVSEFGIHELEFGAQGYSFTGIAPVDGQTYTLVAKLDLDANLISLWVNPNLALPESANPPNVTRAYTSANWITAVRLASGGSGATTWDNLSLGTTWSTVQAALTPPLTVDDSLIMRHHTKSLLDVRRNDAGAGSVEIVTQPAFGTAVLDAAGRIRYTHTTGTPASDSLTYRLNGISGQPSTPATVTYTFSSAGRLPNTTSVIPLTPPGTGIAAVNAFPGVTMTTPSNLAVIPGTNRLIITERTGKIWLIPDVASLTPAKQLFLDLAATVNPRSTEDFEDDGNELGLKGIAFHPDFANNRQFFVAYNLKINGTRYIRLSRFTAKVSNVNEGDPTSEQSFITQQNDSDIHNIASAKFGPDGYLYFSCGDGGPQGDGSNNAQRIDKDFWSAVFRIDVNRLPGNPEPNAHAAIALNPADSNNAFYKVPADNPFIGATSLNGVALPGPGPVRTEMYAIGLRNPWQFNWDSTTGELWVGDVGGNQFEEINLVTPGGNYQWAYKEGNANGPKTNPPSGFTGTPPLYTYAYGNGTYNGNCVTGGLVYRGTKYPSLTGKYIFADFVAGHIWTLQRDGANPPIVQRITGESGIVAMATDPATGDILMLDFGDGVVRRLTTQTIDNTFPAKLSDTGLYADLSDLTTNPGIERYDVNLPFWSDHARKTRSFMLPDTVSTFGYVENGNWSLPTGALWIKHFDMDQTRGYPATAKRLETRLFIKTATSAYGVSYRWNNEGTEAYLVDDNGVDFDMNLTVNGSPYTQRWRIPSRAECMTCHTPQGGHALSFETRQLNRTGTLGSSSGHYLQLLADAGYLSNAPASNSLAYLPKYHPPTDNSQTLETRARSWLAVNCSYCHQSGGTGIGAFDLRPELNLFGTTMIDAHVGNTQHPSHRAILRGLPDSSVIRNRASALNGYTRMPPLGSSEIDPQGSQLLTDWITSMSSTTRPSYTEWRTTHFGNSTSPNGAPNIDADNDGHLNYTEYLANTAPLSSSSFLIPGLSITNGQLTLTHPNLEGRLIHVETSPDLSTWTRWLHPDNTGLPMPGPGTTQFTAPTEAPRRFFRLRIEEQ
jgi:glucose/arabinose dehydrogenase